MTLHLYDGAYVFFRRNRRARGAVVIGGEVLQVTDSLPALILRKLRALVWRRRVGRRVRAALRGAFAQDIGRAGRVIRSLGRMLVRFVFHAFRQGRGTETSRLQQGAGILAYFEYREDADWLSRLTGLQRPSAVVRTSRLNECFKAELRDIRANANPADCEHEN